MFLGHEAGGHAKTVPQTVLKAQGPRTTGAISTRWWRVWRLQATCEHEPMANGSCVAVHGAAVRELEGGRATMQWQGLRLRCRCCCRCLCCRLRLPTVSQQETVVTEEGAETGGAAETKHLVATTTERGDGP